MNRKETANKVEKPRRQKLDWKALEIIHPDAAGIDIGGSEHWVAISPDRDENPVQRFDCFTSDLERMAKWVTRQRGAECRHAIDRRLLGCRCMKS